MLVFPTLLPPQPKKHRTAKVFSAFAVRCFFFELGMFKILLYSEISIVSITTSCTGRSCGPRCAFAISSTVSIPSSTWPNTV